MFTRLLIANADATEYMREQFDRNGGRNIEPGVMIVVFAAIAGFLWYAEVVRREKEHQAFKHENELREQRLKLRKEQRLADREHEKEIKRIYLEASSKRTEK